MVSLGSPPSWMTGPHGVPAPPSGRASHPTLEVPRAGRSLLAAMLPTGLRSCLLTPPAQGCGHLYSTASPSCPASCGFFLKQAPAPGPSEPRAALSD